MQLLEIVKSFCLSKNPSNPLEFKSNSKLVGSWCPHSKTITSQKGKVYPVAGFLGVPKEIKSQKIDNSTIFVTAYPLIGSDGKSQNYHDLVSIYKDAINCLKTEMGDKELQKQYTKRIENSINQIYNLRKALIESLSNCDSTDEDAVCRVNLRRGF